MSMDKTLLKWFPIWVLLICLETEVNAFFLPLQNPLRYWNCTESPGNPIDNIMMFPYTSPHSVVPMYSTPADDDDISQHETMADPTDDNDDSKASKKNGGYRRIEDWHEETVAKNPQHVLTRLQQEKATWEKKFEDLGGDGI